MASLTFKVIGVADDDHLEEVGVCDVGRPQRHHQVPQADERAVPVGENGDDDVVLVQQQTTPPVTVHIHAHESL